MSVQSQPPGVPLVPVPEVMPGLAIDLAYAGPDNMAGRVLYDRPRSLLHPIAAAALARAAHLADALGLVLILRDAFRPVEAQWALWEVCPDPRFVAPPWRGSAHSRGVAVDVELGDPASGRLDMGTGFDDMRPASFHGVTYIPVEAQRNRLLLLGLMVAAGFEHYTPEWWHYQLPGARDFPLHANNSVNPPLMDCP